MLAASNQQLLQANNYMDQMKTSTDHMYASLSSIEIELQPLIQMVEAFVGEGGDCSFIKTHYHTLEARLCKQALPAMLYVGLLTFLTGFFGIFMVTNGLIINKRYE